MVTHIPSPNGSNLSLSPTTSTYRPVYASSQAGSSSLSHNRVSSSSSYHERSRSHSRAPSTSSISSQSTLVQQQAHSVAGYPPTPQSTAGYGSAPSAYRAPSVASTSAARPSRHQHRTSSQSQSRRSRDAAPPRAAAQNAFPWFGQTGDVEICVRDRKKRTERRYLLHGLILAQNAKWFERDVVRLGKDSLSTRRSSVNDHRPSLVGGTTGSGMAYNPPPALASMSQRRLYYELDWSRFSDEQERIPLLVQRDPLSQRSSTASAYSQPPLGSTSNKPPPPSSSFFRNLASGMTPAEAQRQQEQSSVSEDAEILTAYDNLFLSFYNHAPTLSSTNLATAYVDSKLLLHLASAYSAIETVGPRIDHHLLRFGSRLWKQIAKYPPSYLKLGYLARSKAIFAEALTHVVGMWPVGKAQLRRGTPGVDDLVVDLIEDKVEELENSKLRIESKLIKLSLTTGRGERVSPSTGYTDWLALSLYRQWIADNTAPAQSGILKENSSKARPQAQTCPRLVTIYRVLAAGGQEYLTHDECKRFLKLRPAEYSRDNLKRFERRTDELKNLAAEVARPLAKNCLELESESLPHLTCSRCEERDFAYIWSEGGGMT